MANSNSTERRAASISQREAGLQQAVQIASMHTDLIEPGDFVLKYAARFADFLANGPADSAEGTKA